MTTGNFDSLARVLAFLIKLNDAIIYVMHMEKGTYNVNKPQVQNIHRPHLIQFKSERSHDLGIVLIHLPAFW